MKALMISRWGFRKRAPPPESGGLPSPPTSTQIRARQVRRKLAALSAGPADPRGANPKVVEEIWPVRAKVLTGTPAIDASTPGGRSNYAINVIPADFAAEASNVIVLSHPALVAPRSIRQSAKSADPVL